jgi:hypothetical protein
MIAMQCGICNADPTVTETRVLGPFAGLGAPLHSDNAAPHRVRFYGTDLGFSYEHQGHLQFLFGDTMSTEQGDVIEASSGRLLDDSFAQIDLAEWPDPGLIGADNIPRLRFGQNPGTDEMSAIDPGHVFDGLKTPEAGFSNGTNEFAVLLLTKPQGCATDADCDNGMSCDTGLGYRGVPYFEPIGTTLGCFDGEPYCAADTMQTLDGKAVGGTGFCVDKSSSVWADTPAGRVSGMALKQRIGIRDPNNPKKYRKMRDWMTNKFLNTTVRVVPGTGQERSRVYLWGRPGFIGVGATGRSLGVYLAYTDIPTSPDFAWDLHYFTGLDDSGVPQYSDREADAAALDLDTSRDGTQPQEVHDIVQHMSVVRVGHLNKWLMFYGGGIDVTPLPRFGLAKCGLAEIFSGSECQSVVAGNGAIRMRSADNPWGPWSPPQDVIVAGDPQIPGSGQFGAGGALRHPACTKPGCAPHSKLPEMQDEGYGWFYGANIIEEWITPAGDGVDILWNASTWDPYRVILLRTRIQP